MAKMLIILAILGISLALPANNDILDKATANDVYANSVQSDETTRLEKDEKRETQTPGTDFKIETATKLPHPGTAFGRIIDDIFNIPITVLQSVSRLLSNPFKVAAKSPEESAKY